MDGVPGCRSTGRASRISGISMLNCVLGYILAPAPDSWVAWTGGRYLAKLSTVGPRAVCIRHTGRMGQEDGGKDASLKIDLIPLGFCSVAKIGTSSFAATFNCSKRVSINLNAPFPWGLKSQPVLTYHLFGHVFDMCEVADLRSFSSQDFTVKKKEKQRTLRVRCSRECIS